MLKRTDRNFNSDHYANVRVTKWRIIMIRNSALTILSVIIFLMISMPVLAQSYLPGVSDGNHNHDKNSNPSSKSGEMQNNPAKPNVRNPAMVNPSDPTGVNSNTPTSPGAPPSSGARGMNSEGSLNVSPASGH